MKKLDTILVIDDNRGVLAAVQLLLKPHFNKIITLSSPVTLTAVLRQELPTVVLLDMNFTSGINTGHEGLFWLHEIKKATPPCPLSSSPPTPTLTLPYEASKKELLTL